MKKPASASEPQKRRAELSLRRNVQAAKKLWPGILGRSHIAALKALSLEHNLSISDGELTLIDGIGS
jgi:hypothetical protein